MKTDGTEGSFQHTLAGRVAALEEAVKAQVGGRKRPKKREFTEQTGNEGSTARVCAPYSGQHHAPMRCVCRDAVVRWEAKRTAGKTGSELNPFCV